MDLQRRDVLKAGGVAAVAGLTGLAGCSGRGGAGGDWQYDPTLLIDAQNVFFGSMDYATVYENRDALPQSTREDIETSDSPVDPSSIDQLYGVGAADVSTDGQTGSAAGSVVLTGEFDAEAVGEEITAEDGTQVGEYEGYTLYESESVSDGFGPETTGSATIGVSGDALVFGFAGASGDSAEVTGRDAVETAIDAGNGETESVRGNGDAAAVLDTVGDATLQAGGVGDPELIDQYAALAGSEAQQYVQGLRAAGAGMTLEGETTVFTVAIVYEDESAAEETGLASLVEGLAPQITQEEGINEVTSSQEGRTIVVTVEGDTETLLQQADSAAPGGV